MEKTSDDSTRKISSLEETISVANQCDTEEVKEVKLSSVM